MSRGAASRRALAGPIAAVLAWAMAPSPAGAHDVCLGGARGRVDVTSTTTVGWHGDNDDGAGGAADDDYAEIFERLNLAGVSGAWSVGLRLDTATFLAEDASATFMEDRYTPEKLTAKWTGRGVEVTAGDSYVSFGRGLALSLRKVDELGVDTTVRGAKVQVRTGPAAATLIAGIANVQNVDEGTGRSVDDPLDVIGGAQAQVRLGGRATAGGHVAAFVFREPFSVPIGEEPDRWSDRYVQGGPTLDAPRLTPRVGVYLEGIAQHRRDSREAAGEDSLGLGLYGTVTIYAGRATVLLEGKSYGDLEPVRPHAEDADNLGFGFEQVQYTNPPTAERILQLIDEPQREVHGGRARVDWTLRRGLAVSANYGLFRDLQGYGFNGEHVPGTIHDPYVALDARWDQARSRAIVSGGWRGVRAEDVDRLLRQDLHAELDVVVALGRDWALELNGLHDERRKVAGDLFPDVDIQDYREGTVQVGARYAGRVSLYGGLDYSTAPLQAKTYYPNATAAWELTPASSVRLFVGSQRGGLRCISGVCRTFAPFEGARVAVTIRF